MGQIDRASSLRWQDVDPDPTEPRPGRGDRSLRQQAKAAGFEPESGPLTPPPAPQTWPRVLPGL